MSLLLIQSKVEHGKRPRTTVVCVHAGHGWFGRPVVVPAGAGPIRGRPAGCGPASALMIRSVRASTVARERGPENAGTAAGLVRQTPKPMKKP